MAEIAAVPDNGRVVVSLFSGCGGSCLGFRWAGYRTLWASEFVPAARETYQANFPATPVDDRDIRAVSASEILDAIGRDRGDVDVLEGSPPCASFSAAGKLSRGWGVVKPYSDTKQRVDDLFDEYLRIVDGVRPRVAVAENVAGLARGVAVGFYNEIIRQFQAIGYRVGARVLDAQWLGVPQMRQRTIFVAVRDDLDRDPAFPKPLPYRYSIRDAIPSIRRLTVDMSTSSWSRTSAHYDADRSAAPTISANGIGARQGSDPAVHLRVERDPAVYDLDAPVPSVTTYGLSADQATDWRVTTDPETGEDITLDRYAIGPAYDVIGSTQSKQYPQLKRSRPSGPSHTVTALGGVIGVASVTHPTERRKFTIGELRRICGFPDDFVLTGTYRQQWERLGRAVPPPMMRAVAETISREIFDA